MEEILYNSDKVEMKYDKSNFLLILIWKRNTDPDEYKKLFEKMIEFSEKNKIQFFLSDLRNQGVVRTQDVKWLELEVLKRAMEQKVKKIALIFDDMIFSTVYAETIKKKLLKSTIQVQFFSDPHSAKAWLSSNEE
jgi:hypothetical protein